MPRQIIVDNEKPRRRRATAVAVEPERGFAMRVLLHSPKDTLAAAAALIVALGIVSNALFLQPGRHPAPMFGAAPVSAPVQSPASTQAPIPRIRPPDADSHAVEVKPADVPVALSKPQPAVHSAAPRPPAAIHSAKSDPVADLIVSTRRVAAVQRALTEYGYGQIKPTGAVGPDTTAAIQKFERDRKQPITGQISDRLIRDLTVLTGRPIE
ncbi:MAG: peptidoglycan-binding protein [Afipia sp.]|nr:peptidoglycan-binding protein [Afipia sp.]